MASPLPFACAAATRIVIRLVCFERHSESQINTTHQARHM